MQRRGCVFVRMYVEMHIQPYVMCTAVMHTHTHTYVRLSAVIIALDIANDKLWWNMRRANKTKHSVGASRCAYGNSIQTLNWLFVRFYSMYALPTCLDLASPWSKFHQISAQSWFFNFTTIWNKQQNVQTCLNRSLLQNSIIHDDVINLKLIRYLKVPYKIRAW